MACRIAYKDGKPIGFACGNFKSAKQDRCGCGNSHLYLCDYPIQVKPKKVLCSKKLCDDCVLNGVSENVHFCEEHYQLARQAYERKLNNATPLFNPTEELSKPEKRGRALFAMGCVNYVDGLRFTVLTPTINNRGINATVLIHGQTSGKGCILRCDCETFKIEVQSDAEFRCEHIIAVRHYLEKEVFNEKEKL